MKKNHVNDVYECVQFSTDQNKIKLAVFNVVSLGDCWALPEVFALQMHLLNTCTISGQTLLTACVVKDASLVPLRSPAEQKGHNLQTKIPKNIKSVHSVEEICWCFKLSLKTYHTALLVPFMTPNKISNPSY